MNTFFTIKDIKEFLLSKGFPKWDGEIDDRRDVRKASIEDFFDYTTWMVFDSDPDFRKYLKVSISDFEFCTFREESEIMGSGSTTYHDKDFTKDWIQFLLNRYGKDYARNLVAYSEKHINHIKDRNAAELERKRQEIERKNQRPIERI